MSKVQRVRSVQSADQDLRILLEKFMQRSEELEEKENKVLRQVELMQSAVASLQAWNQNRIHSGSVSEPVRLNVREIEEETRQIQEETKRIQKEVLQKIEENKKLQDELDKRREEKTNPVDETVSDAYIFTTDDDEKPKRPDREEFGTCSRIDPGTPPQIEEDPGIRFFNSKLTKLRQIELKLKKESFEEAEKAQKRKRSLKEKIEMLEWESEIDRQLIQSLRRKYSNK